MLIVAIVVAIIVVAAISVWALIYLSAGSLRVNTTSTFVPAGQSASFNAAISTPALVSAGPVSWNFGDGSTVPSGNTNTTHAYSIPGTFFVYASSTLSNGKIADNSMALFPMTVGPKPIANPNPLGEIHALGAITINKSASSPGAPIISTGGSIDFLGAVQQDPTFAYSVNTSNGWTPTSTAQWTNYSWSVVQLSFNFGDNSPVKTSTSAPFEQNHTYANAGIYAATLTVTSQNYTEVTSCANLNCTSPVVTDTATTNCGGPCTVTTTVGESVAVGAYGLVTYSGNVVNPGVIVNSEAVTGSYFSLDPAIDYESTGFEILTNVYETLLQYNGTSTDSFVSVLADAMPAYNSTGPWAFMNYTFHIRQGLRFSNGDPVTPWDVKYSITRTMLFVTGSPGTPGWIISQYLILNPDGSFNESYAMINSAITISNATQTVTFHLSSAAPPLLFEQIVANPLGSAIMDHAWLESVGPHLVWSQAGFDAYRQYSVLPNYINAWRNGAVGSGPYMIDYISPPDAVVLKANPYYTPKGSAYPAPQVPRVVLQYVADDSTRELSLQSGKADVAGILSNRFNVALNQQQQGLAKILFFPTLNLFWWNFNMNIYQSGSSTNPYQNGVPPDFFVDLNMRKAFYYAFNFQQYIDQIVGNKVYNAKFGELYNGIIPKGMIGYQDLSSLDIFSMQLAHFYFNRSAWVQSKTWLNSGFTLAINVENADSVNKAAAAAWAQNIEALGPPGKINIVVKPISFEEMITNSVPDADPMAIYYLGWLPDYPYPTDYTVPMLLPGTDTSPYGGTYPAANGVNITYFAQNAADTPNGFSFKQSANLSHISDEINASVSTTDIPTAIRLSQSAQRDAANLTLYVPAQQQYYFFTYRTWITGMEGETNPVLGGAALLYQLLTKPTSLATSAVQSLAAGMLPLMGMAFASPLATIALVGLGIRPGASERKP